MKKAFVLISLFFAFSQLSKAQLVCFWTDESEALPIRIYVDEAFVGEISACNQSAPEYGAEGTVSIEIDPGRHKIDAINSRGYKYCGWPDKFYPSEEKVNFVRVRQDQFRDYATDAFFFYDPFFPGPHSPYSHRHRAPEGEDYLSDDALLSFAITAATTFVTFGALSVVNWDFPDSRFPYMAVGVKSEYMPGINSFRNVARLKGRIGNFGGMSFLGDCGYSIAGGGWSAPTFSFGLGWAYGAFETDFRYKPATRHTPDTFITVDFSYDWFVSSKFALDFNLGFGLSGYEELGNRWGGFELPFGVGLMYKF